MNGTLHRSRAVLQPVVGNGAVRVELAVCHQRQRGALLHRTRVNRGRRLASIRDFRYVPYITRDGLIALAV